jgi:hypothetical protein
MCFRLDEGNAVETKPIVPDVLRAQKLRAIWNVNLSPSKRRAACANLLK